MIPDQPSLTKEERGLSSGIFVLYYTDGDRRLRYFEEHSLLDITQEKYPDADDPYEEAMLHINEDARGAILSHIVPGWQRGMELQREEPGEPQHAGYEWYWKGELVWDERVEPYDPVPVEETING